MTIVDTLVGQLGDKPQMYHMGLVVPDVKAASEQYSDLFGLRWRSLRETVLRVRVDGKLREADLLVTYSMDGPTYIELIEDRSGDTWALDALGLNHVGFWAKDLAAASAKLEASGLPARVHDDGNGDGKPTRFTYHPGLGGVWMELVAPHFAQTLQDWMVTTLTDNPSA